MSWLSLNRHVNASKIAFLLPFALVGCGMNSVDSSIQIRGPDTVPYTTRAYVGECIANSVPVDQPKTAGIISSVVSVLIDKGIDVVANALTQAGKDKLRTTSIFYQMDNEQIPDAFRFLRVRSRMIQRLAAIKHF